MFKLDNEEWRIEDDNAADWAVQKIAESRAEFERIKAIADKQIEEITAKVEKLKNRCDSETSNLEYKLMEYFQTVHHKSTKTLEKYELLSGVLKLKKAQRKPVVDDEKLVEWLAENNYSDFIKVEKKPRWADLKKGLDLSGEIPTIKETGEVVEGITFEEVPEEFEIEIR